MTSPLDRLHSRLTEAYAELTGSFVDPREPYCDDNETWLPLASGPNSGPLYPLGPANESQLSNIRLQCAQLALENEFAINGHENRISYIIGPGHTYRAVPAKAQRLGLESHVKSSRNSEVGGRHFAEATSQGAGERSS